MKTLLGVMLFLVGAGTRPALAQRHDKHMATVAGHFGRSEKGEYVELSYLPYLTNHLALRVSGSYEYGTLSRRGQYSSWSGRAFFAPQLFRLGEFAYVHLLLGGGAGYEQTSRDGNGERPADARKPARFTFGPQAGVEVDFFLGNRFSLVATGTKSYLFHNPLLDEWPGHAGAGLRYHFR